MSEEQGNIVWALQRLWNEHSPQIKVARDSRFPDGSTEDLYFGIVRADDEGGFNLWYCAVILDQDSGEYGEVVEVDALESEYLGETFDEASKALMAIIAKGISF